jgi:hypothetical protein
MGFVQSKTDSSLFVYNRNGAVSYLLLYVDGMILSASTVALLWHIIAHLQDLGIAVQRTSDGFSSLGPSMPRSS